MTGQRRALLIGVSEFGEGYAPLPGAMRDLDETSRVLANPTMGSFQIADILRNPDAANIGSALRQFLSAGQTDDTLLVYFTGHGAKGQFDDQLYLAGSNTRKLNGELDEASAFSSNLLRQYLMNKRACRASCVIVILDCCFSGAVFNWLKKGDDFLESFRAEGKVIMAACSAAESAYQPAEADAPNQPPLSIYTRYLIQGIEQGTAQQPNQDWITAQDLHHYISRSIQAESPAEMHPKLIALDESAFVRIAKVPKGDPVARYRQEVEDCVRRSNGSITKPARRLLNRAREKYNLTQERADLIEKIVLERWRNLAEYKAAYTDAIQDGYPLSEDELYILQKLRDYLGLTDADVAPIHTDLTPSSTFPASDEIISLDNLFADPIELTDLFTNSIEIETPSKYPSEPINQEPKTFSETSLDCTRLHNLLAKAANSNSTEAWQAADEETLILMEKALGKSSTKWTSNDLLNFPCPDLQAIDSLWANYSQRHFGFGVQKEIYIACGAQPNSEYVANTTWHRFCTQVGWRVNNFYIYYSSIDFDISASRGHLPCKWVSGFLSRWDRFSSLISRFERCIQESIH